MTTFDAFLDGQLRLHQPRQGFRSGVDAVLLAAACPAQRGDQVLELGCGVGVAGLCLARRLPVVMHGIELQAEYADLARRNARENGIEMTVWQADLNALPTDLRALSFDHVIANPPYFRPGCGTAATDTGRDTALAGATPLEVWLRVAGKRLRPKGWLTMIQRMDRLPDMIRALPADMGSIVAQPICARQGRDPHLVLLLARKQGRTPFELRAPFVMHEGAAHLSDGEDFTPQARAILRAGAALPILRSA